MKILAFRFVRYSIVQGRFREQITRDSRAGKSTMKEGCRGRFLFTRSTTRYNGAFVCTRCAIHGFASRPTTRSRSIHRIPGHSGIASVGKSPLEHIRWTALRDSPFKPIYPRSFGNSFVFFPFFITPGTKVATVVGRLFNFGRREYTWRISRRNGPLWSETASQNRWIASEFRQKWSFINIASIMSQLRNECTE